MTSRVTPGGRSAARRGDRRHTPHSHPRLRLRGHAIPIACALGFALLLGTLLPLSGGAGLIPIASAHALLVRSDPAAHAVLQAPPSQVRLWFSEDVNPGTSHAVVVDTTNREVDNHDSHVNPGDSTQIDVGLPLLPAGTYVVAWQTQSADDGHITSGSFYFQIARPDGSVPPVPAQLPTGHVPGAGGSATGGNVDAQTLVQAAFTWLALLFMTFWVGGLIWETWILAPGTGTTSGATDGAGAACDPDLAAAAQAGARRFRRLAVNALCLVLVMDVGIVLAQSADLAGEWSGAVSPPLLRAILFGSRYGDFWWLRQLTVLAALGLMYLADRRGWQPQRPQPVRLGAVADAEDTGATGDTADATATAGGGAVPDWRRELLAVLRRVPQLPGRLVRGWRARSLYGRGELLLGALLILAFALSGHAAAVPAREFAYALSVDLFHLVCETAWVGGLFYISAVFVPALVNLADRQRARVLALGLPEFSAVAIVCAVLLAATGSLNTTVHLDSIQQFLTTAYGRILAVKIEFFLFMVAISAYHAFSLRPRLALALADAPDAAPDVADASASVAVTEAAVTNERRAAALAGSTIPARAGHSSRGDVVGASGGRPADGNGLPDDERPSHAAPTAPLSNAARRLAERLEDWLGREAMIGVVILLCVALLGAYAGSLATTPASAATPATTAHSPFVQTQTVQGYAISLKVTPDTFGTNTFYVTVKTGAGQSLTGASVIVTTANLDMDMGTQSVQLQPVGGTPGTYSGQADLTMAGHWEVIVKVIPPNSTQPISTPFKFTATY